MYTEDTTVAIDEVVEAPTPEYREVSTRVRVTIPVMVEVDVAVCGIVSDTGDAYITDVPVIYDSDITTRLADAIEDTPDMERRVLDALRRADS